MKKLVFIVAWLIEDPLAYARKKNADIEREILEEAPTIPYVAKIEKVSVLDASRQESREKTIQTEGKLEKRRD